jgi:esterase/lipase
MLFANRWLTLICVVVLAACSSNDPTLNKSSTPIAAPDKSQGFSEYVTASRSKIDNAINTARSKIDYSYLGEYTNQQAAEMRTPFELLPAHSCNNLTDSPKIGFLLIHGLTDSPFLLKDIASDLHKVERFPCSTIRAISLPGHSTIAGDSLDMKHQDWTQAVKYGMSSLINDENIDHIYLVGFSTGTSLIIREMAEAKPNTDKIKGLIMLSTAMKAKSGAAWLAGIAKYFVDWLDEYPEFDAARYTSFSANAGAQFYDFTKPIDANKTDYHIEIPMLMVVSADDATIDPQAALDIFCAGTKPQHNSLIWYQSSDTPTSLQLTDGNAPKGCSPAATNVHATTLASQPQDSSYYTADNTRYFVRNIAHTAISISPENKHYGAQGAYPQCKHYWNTDDFEKCVDVSNQDLFQTIVFGETPQREKIEQSGKLYRRGTFNPFYEQMLNQITNFIEKTENL